MPVHELSIKRPKGLLQTLVNERNNNPRRYHTGLSGRLYPNGEFTLGKVPPKIKTPKEEAYDKAWEAQHDYVEWYEYKYGTRIKKVYRFLDPSLQEKALLGLSPLTNSHKRESDPGDMEAMEAETTGVKRKPRGRKGITGKGKRMTRNGAWLLQKAFGKKQLGFATVTLPSFPDDPVAFLLLVNDWSELVRQFFQQLTRYLRRSGFQARWVGVTEIQPKRLKERGEAAPHLHFVYHAHNGDYRWFITANEMRRIWKQVLEACIKKWTDVEYSVDTSAAIDTQSVKKDAGAYLAKYMSKGSDVIKLMEEKGLEDFIPSAWWHCCVELKKAVLSLVQELPSDIKTAIVEGVDLVARGVAVYLMEIIKDDKKYGWVGRLKRSLSRDGKLLQVIKSFEKPLPLTA
ncbi:MAG: hypothetical protein ACK5PQ_02370 [Alphaproteobacteria bacterium]